MVDNLATAMLIRLLSGAASVYRYGMHPPPALADAPVGLLVAVILIGIGCSVFGGYAAGRFAGRREAAHGLLVGFGDVLIGAVAVLHFAAPMPAWYNAVSFAAVMPAAVVGGRWAARVRHAEA
jgi:hypothetical protein